MPKASLPTLSPATVQHTEQAMAQFEGIVAQGGWPEVAQSDRLRLGSRHPAVSALRQRLAISGDLDAHAGVSDIYDSYVEAGVRRFQARHGLSVDGIVRDQTLKSMNVPAAVRLAQLRTNLVRLRSLSGNLGARHVVAATSRRRGSRRSRAASRCRATPRSPASRTGRRPTSTPRSSRSTSIRTGPCRCRSCGAISFRRCRPSRTISSATTSASSTCAATSSRRRRSTGTRKRR